MPNNHWNHRKNGKREPAHDPLAAIAGLSAQALRETDEALTTREKLTARFLHEIEKEIDAAVRMLHLLGPPWRHGQDSLQYEFMRVALDKALYARKRERRERLLQAWRDLLELRERRRELLRELQALRQ